MITTTNFNCERQWQSVNEKKKKKEDEEEEEEEKQLSIQ